MNGGKLCDECGGTGRHTPTLTTSYKAEGILHYNPSDTAINLDCKVCSRMTHWSYCAYEAKCSCGFGPFALIVFWCTGHSGYTPHGNQSLPGAHDCAKCENKGKQNCIHNYTNSHEICDHVDDDSNHKWHYSRAE